jgi:hypothetical protein
MQIVHSQLTILEKVSKPTKKQIYHEQQVQALRRRKFVDYETALRDPEIIALIKKVQQVSPGWQPKFRG